MNHWKYLIWCKIHDDRLFTIKCFKYWAICAGYSKLAKEIFDLMGVKCVIVTGWSHAAGYKLGDQF